MTEIKASMTVSTASALTGSIDEQHAAAASAPNAQPPNASAPNAQPQGELSVDLSSYLISILSK